MGIVLANNAHTTLTANIGSTDTTIYVDDVDSFPSLDVDEYFYCTIESTTGTHEIVKVTQVNAASFNVVRGQEGTIAVPFNIGARVELRVTVQSLEDRVEDQIDARYTAADVLAKLLTVDGTGSGLDADLLDGSSISAFGLLASANAWTNNNSFNKRITIDPTNPVFDQGGNVLASFMYFGDGSVTSGASQRLDFIRSDNTLTPGDGGVAHFINANIIAGAGSAAASDVRIYTGFLQNAGPGTVTTSYYRAESLPGSTGHTFANKMGVKTTTGGGTVAVRQATNDTDSGDATYAFDWWTSNTANVTNSQFGLIADSKASFSSAFLRCYAVGAGDFANLKNSDGSADLFRVLSTGAITSASTISGTVLTGSTSLIASSSSNGVTITQSAVSRNAAGGSLTIAAGTNAGNLLTFTTAGSTRFTLSDSAATFNVSATPASNDGAALGTTALSWADLFLASGAVVNFNNGNYTLTHSSGLLTASGNFTGVTLLGTTSVIAASSTNGMTLTQSALSRNAAGGSMTIAAGTNAGNTIAMNTGGSARVAVSDTGVAITGVCTSTGSMTARSTTAIPAGGTVNVGLMMSSTASFGVFFGSGAPTLAAAKGSLYLRSDGSGTNDRMYVNTDGSTAWTAVVTAT